MVFLPFFNTSPITEGTLLKMYQTALPDYISAFLISITDEVYKPFGWNHLHYGDRGNLVCCQGNPYMTDGLNSVNDLEENRNWFVLRLWAIVYTIVFLFAVVFTLVVLVFGNTLHDLASRVYSIAAEYHESDREISWLCAFWHFICIF